MDSTTTKIKSFWERPEGNTGLIVLGLLALGIFFGGQAIFPSLIMWLNMATAVVGKTIVLAALCGVAALLVAIGLNERFQTAMSFMFKSSMRSLTSVIIKNDPIGMMKSYIEKLVKKKETFDENKTSLRGQIRLCDEQIGAVKKEIARDEQSALYAKNQGNMGQMTVYGRNMERNREQLERMQNTKAKMEMFYKFLVKYSEATDLVIQDMENDVRARERDLKFSTATHNAMKSAWDILKGEGVGKDMYDEASEFALADYAQKMGEIDDFMESTKSIMDGIDLQNGMWEQAALERLNAFESKSSILLGGEKRLMIESSTPQYATTPLNSLEGSPVEYEKFFK